jgi:hypothetical protein
MKGRAVEDFVNELRRTVRKNRFTSSSSVRWQIQRAVLQDSTRRWGRRMTERGLHDVLIEGQFVSSFYYWSYLVRPISQAFGAQVGFWPA